MNYLARVFLENRIYTAISSDYETPIVIEIYFLKSIDKMTTSHAIKILLPTGNRSRITFA